MKFYFILFHVFLFFLSACGKEEKKCTDIRKRALEFKNYSKTVETAGTAVSLTIGAYFPPLGLFMAAVSAVAAYESGEASEELYLKALECYEDIERQEMEEFRRRSEESDEVDEEDDDESSEEDDV